MRAVKSLAVALAGVMAINFAALGGLVGWLAMTGRLNKQRVQEVVKVFDHTIAHDKQQQKEAKEKAQKQAKRAERAARLERVKDGPITMQDRLAAKQRADQIAMHRLNRLQEETGDLRQQIERAKSRITEQRKALEQKRKQFEQFVKQRTQQMKKKDFKKAVAMYESVGADKAKRMFQQLLANGEQDQVVKYLAAMQQRAASKILQAFEGPQEVQQATNLIERLRKRGENPLGGEPLPEGGDQP
jgi:type IV secretory pathway VirB10-like protein